MILCENKRILRKKGNKNFEANKRNACETDLCSLRFALKRKQNLSENRTPYASMNLLMHARLGAREKIRKLEPSGAFFSHWKRRNKGTTEQRGLFP
jgi:hypothetical protein